MTTVTGKEAIILHTLSKSKSNQKIKFPQLIKCIERNVFLQIPSGKWVRETSFLFKKAYCDGYDVKASGLQLSI